MSRLIDLVSSLSSRFPESEYLSNLQVEMRERRSIFSEIRVYARALECLDVDSWKVLHAEARQRFRIDPDPRGQAPLFDILNSAVAYRHLKKRGYSYVRCLSEKRDPNAPKNPDLLYRSPTGNKYCEVKTFHRSDHELRREQLHIYSASVYDRLPSRFFDKKFDPVLSRAVTQIGDEGHGFVFAVIHFDDIGPFNRSKYKQQLAQHLETRWPNLEVYMRFGVDGPQHLHHVPNGAAAHA